MELLPPALEQEWLIEELSALVAGHGAERFVAAPLILPTDEHFPDRWTSDSRGVATLLSRILTYAGLGELGMRLELGHFRDVRVEADARGRLGESSHSGTAAWFAGIHRGVARFGVDVKQLESPDVLVGTLAHEVAHAFRHHHRLEVDDRDLEERLTDLTTVYLGFGILTTNSTQRYRSGGGMSFTEWSHSRGGYLSPQAMAYALATQVRARGRDGERALVRKHLETNQAACFSEAYKGLADVATRLDLPPRESWPAPWLLPVVENADEVIEEEEQEVEDDLPDQATFRLACATPSAAAWLVALAVIIVGVAWLFPHYGAMVAAATPVVAFVALVVLQRRWDQCVDPDCRAVIPAEAPRCPGCRAIVAGRVARREDRLEARIAWEKERRR